MSTSILKALPGKLDIKRRSPSTLYVQVYDGSVEDGELLGTYCGTNSPHMTLIATSSLLTVTFHSDYMIGGTGFNLTYFLGMPLLIGPRRKKTCLRGFRYIETQTNLFSYRDYLEK